MGRNDNEVLETLEYLYCSDIEAIAKLPIDGRIRRKYLSRLGYNIDRLLRRDIVTEVVQINPLSRITGYIFFTAVAFSLAYIGASVVLIRFDNFLSFIDFLSEPPMSGMILMCLLSLCLFSTYKGIEVLSEKKYITYSYTGLG